METQERQFCMEYLITGVHQQQKNSDCVFCYPQKIVEEMKKIQENINREEEKDKNIPDEDQFDDAYEDLKQQIGDEQEEEETQNLVEKKLDEQISQKLLAIQQQSLEILDKLLANENHIEFILDNSMGLVINPNNVSENHFTLARRVLSLALEKWQPQLKHAEDNSELNQKYLLEWKEDLKKKTFNIYTSEQDIQLSKESVNISELQRADEFLENIELHVKKDRILSILQSRIQQSLPQVTSIIIFTDYLSKDFSAWKQQIEEVIKQRQNVPKIHIFSLNLSQIEKEADKLASFSFFESISKLTHGNFKGFSQL